MTKLRVYGQGSALHGGPRNGPDHGLLTLRSSGMSLSTTTNQWSNESRLDSSCANIATNYLRQ